MSQRKGDRHRLPGVAWHLEDVPFRVARIAGHHAFQARRVGNLQFQSARKDRLHVRLAQIDGDGSVQVGKLQQVDSFAEEFVDGVQT